MIKKKTIYIILAVLIIAAIVATVLLLCMPKENEIDIVAYNRLAEEIGNNWDEVADGKYFVQSDLPYCVVSLSGETVIGEKIGESYNESINRAVKQGYPVLDIVNDGDIVGKLIIASNNSEYIERERHTVLIAISVFFSSLIIIIVVYLLYLEYIVFRPFKKMSDYASFIANGELDIPLEMDRGNIFGAYSESFNTMRLQLKAAKDAENKARKDKENFILEINHDMLSPLAVIKAAVQNMSVKDNDPHISLIEEKSEELESILNDLMTVNLQDNNEYKMYIDEVSSNRLVEILKMCDYKQKINEIKVDDCIVKCDEMRTAQIFSNILNNSYKYADTKIDVSGETENGKLVLSIRDYGQSLNPDELDRLTERYFRGSNALSGNGAGLGLHIVEACQRKQGGDVYLKYDNGLIVILVFDLS